MIKTATHNRAIKAQEGERRCLVSGLPAPREKLIRFVRSPEGIVCPDFAEKLGGRGVWISNQRAVLQEAIDKRLFSCRGFGKGTIIPKDLVVFVENGLQQRALNMLAFANKAGVLIFGFEKVKEFARQKKIAFLIQAKDGSQAEKERLSACVGEVKVYRLFSQEELGKKIGRDSCVHIAIQESQIAKSLEKEMLRLEAFLGEEKNE